MRNPVNNPFSPGSDTVPDVWAGRTEQLSDWRDVVRPRLMKGLSERGRTILGEPGLGKSSLVRRIAQQAERDGDWVTPQLRVPLGSDPLKLVAAATLKLADRAGLASSRERRLKELLGRVQTVAASGVSLTLRGHDGPEPHMALTELLVEVGRAAMTHDAVVLIHIDEVQNITDEKALSQLLIALGDAITHEVVYAAPGGVQVSRSLPIAVYLTGLPDFEDRAGALRGATFARRFSTTVLTPLEDDDLAEALREFITTGWEVFNEAGGVDLIRMEADAATAIVDACRGEPFLFQLAGQRAWDADSSDVITRGHVLRGWLRAQEEAVAHVERILARLPQREREFVEAMAELQPEDRTLTRIAAAVGYGKVTEAGPTSQRLDRVRGIITRGGRRPYTFRHRAIEAFLTSEWPDMA